MSSPFEFRPDPYTDEEERLAEQLVDEAMIKYRHTLSAHDFEETREFFIVKLLSTDEGKAKLAALRAAQLKARKALH
jgi:hypothetical protein